MLNLSCSIVVKSLDGLYFVKRYENFEILKIGCYDFTFIVVDFEIQLGPTVLATVYSDPSFYNMMKIPSLSRPGSAKSS